ncbi:MAG: flagellar brake protein [Methylobacterium sp.]|nr:flagellar brake protein [Methylobacterium sp.]
MSEDPTPKSSKLETRNCKFEELQLAVDQRLQIEGSNQQKTIHGRLLGYLKGASLIVKLPVTQTGGVALKEGENVVVRGFSGRIAFVFNSRLERIRYTPYPYCHLQFPTLIHGADVRREIRTPCNILAKVVNPRLGNDKAMEATISDISATGAMLRSGVQLGEVGDSLNLSFRFWIPPNDYEVNLQTGAVIQACMLGIEESAGDWQQGIRFEGMRPTENILLQNLIYQLLQTNPGTRV